jgi:uncharacterized protein YdeI (YjbR/CyaY-like superfamily)
MEIGRKLYVTDRRTWRSWLAKHHDKEKEIWLVYMKKNSGKQRIPYNDAVEEALCYGWIDSILKPIDENCYAQRFSPRRPGSQLSAMNKERIRRLIGLKKMTPAGTAAIKHVSDASVKNLRLIIGRDIQKALKEDKDAWRNFRKFSASYKRIRIGWIEAARDHPQIFKQRLGYFIKMTARNKMYGMVR